MSHAVPRPDEQAKPSESFARFLDESQRLRRQTLDLIVKAIDLAEAAEVPPPPEALRMAERKLSNDDYNVLVAGEIKRGKSTLVNALTGLSLPTDIDVATSQVFRVYHADQTAYHVRYDDGDTLGIAAADLARYGSVAGEAEGDTANPDRPVKWIEVGMPYTFLPKNVSLLDTPGVGGTNAGHATIVHRFVDDADAVIFVLDSLRPIDDAEVRFLATIVGRTRHVFFVQTKIDGVRPEEWEAVRAKSSAVLKEKFGDTLSDTTVWPLSSLLLQKAAAAGPYADVRLIASKHREFAPALGAFLYRVVGWSRVADGVLLAEAFLGDVAKLLNERIDALGSREAAEARRRKQRQKKQYFDDEHSHLRTITQQAVDRVRDEGRRSAHRIEDRITAAEHDLRDRIETLSSVGDSEQFGPQLHESMLGQADVVWHEARQHAVDVYASTLATLLIDAEHELPLADRPASEFKVALPKMEGSFLNRVNIARNHMMNAGVVVGLPVTVLVTVGVLAAPVAVTAGAAAAAWGLISGWRQSGRAEAAVAKAKLQQHLDKIVRSVRTHYARHNEELYRTLEQSLHKAMGDFTARKRREADTELTRLQDEDRLDQQQREMKAKQTTVWLGEMKQLSGSIATMRARVNALAHQLPLPAAGAA